MRAVGRGFLRIITIGLFGLAALWPSGLQANHIIGGDLTMQAVGTTPGLFRLQLIQFWDELQTGAGNRDPNVTLLIYRKNNPVLMEAIRLDLQEALPLAFDNAACAKLRKLNFTQARYYRTYQFDVSRYTDPGGYYIVWERCCRNDALTNAVSVGGAGVAMTFYLEFPPMSRNGQPFKNSSPDFQFPNGDYICINKPFTFDAGATDADGDKLVFSLVTPLNGYTSRTQPLGSQDVKNGYPTVTWAPGISLANVIPGNPSLSINAQTGQLSVRATKEGLYLFTVQVEEFRNGERIGLVRRDLQLPVIDCSKETPTPPIVRVGNAAPASQNLVWCDTQPLTLTVEKNPLWAYQWQRNGDNLRGDTTNTLLVQEPGVYTVVKSLAKACANDTSSLAYTVTFVSGAPVSVSALNDGGICTGDTATLVAQGQPDYQYRWQRDGTDLPGEQKSTLRTTQPGRYVVFAKPAAAVCEGRDTLIVTTSPRPTVSLTASQTVLCPSDTLLLRVQSSLPGRYVWQQNGAALTDTLATLRVSQVGTYRAVVSTPAGCTAATTTFTVGQAVPPTLTGQTQYSLLIGDQVSLQTSANQPISQYRWDPPATLSRADIGSPVARPGQTTTYKLTATNASGCSDTLVVRVDVVDMLLIPTAFSPNGDGMNDTWALPNIRAYPVSEVSVYDRWGELVFYSKGYDSPWDGTFRQEQVMQGVYTYQIRIGAEAISRTYRGQLTVVR